MKISFLYPAFLLTLAVCLATGQTLFSQSSSGEYLATTASLEVKTVKDYQLSSTNAKESTTIRRVNFDVGAQAREATFTDVAAYLAEQIEYADILQANGVEGSVTVAIVLDETGQVRNAQVIESLHPVCDEAALKAVQAMPAWKPAELYGRAVPSRVVVAVDFRR